MGMMASKITSVSISSSTVCSGADQRKHQSPASLAHVRGNHRWPVDSPPHKGPGPCITNVIATCRKNFSQWERSFLWKLRCHWLKFLRRVAKTLVIPLAVTRGNVSIWRRHHGYGYIMSSYNEFKWLTYEYVLQSCFTAVVASHDAPVTVTFGRKISTTSKL